SLAIVAPETKSPRTRFGCGGQVLPRTSFGQVGGPHPAIRGSRTRPSRPTTTKEVTTNDRATEDTRDARAVALGPAAVAIEVMGRGASTAMP
ncbi:MAG TPA: hypothetical protein VFD38_20815, partial [Myxococcaceae bacterium]|nr:hypothetical protein [Myxococcaceae bacterium]